jgi:hypothetical protein
MGGGRKPRLASVEDKLIYNPILLQVLSDL